MARKDNAEEVKRRSRDMWIVNNKMMGAIKSKMDQAVLFSARKVPQVRARSLGANLGLGN